MSIYTLAESTIESTHPVALENLDVGVPSTPSQSETLDNLTKYIPTESITLYVAALGIVTAAGGGILPFFFEPVFLYWLCAVLTPIIFVALLLRKRAIAGLSLRPEKWPIWKIVAATIAFLVWALAVPGSPYTALPGGSAIAAVGALFVSTFLSLLDPIFDRFAS